MRVAGLLAAGLSAGCGVLDPNRDGAIREFTAVTYAQGRYVAAGVAFRAMDDAVVPGSDTAVIFISDDGRNWREVSLRVPARLMAVTFGGDRFVAVGTFLPPNGIGRQESDPVVLTSLDGETWTAAPNLPDLWWRSIAFGNGRFVATGFNPATLLDEILVSDDGVTWDAVAITDIPSTEITFGNGVFVLWGESNSIGVSTDGANWEVVGVESVGQVRDIAYLDGRFIGTGDFDCCFGEVAGTQTVYTLESENGTTWNVREQALGEVFFSHSFGNGRFVATSGREIAVADDSFTWTVVAAFNEWVGDVVYGNDGFVTAGRIILFSVDGLEWERVD